MDELLHFPESFPMRALTVLAPIVRTGKVENRVEAGEAAITIQAWAMGQWLGTEGGPEAARAPVRSRSPVPAKVSVNAAEKALDSLEKASAPSPEGAQAAPFNGRKFAENALKLAKFVLPIILGF